MGSAGPGRSENDPDLPLGLLEQLAPHLGRLLGLLLPHRIESARALHRILTKPATLQQHARALGVSTATLRHRLAPLDPILGHGGHSPDHLVALASVLPALDHLWHAELLDPVPSPRSAEVGASVPAAD